MAVLSPTSRQAGLAALARLIAGRRGPGGGARAKGREPYAPDDVRIREYLLRDAVPVLPLLCWMHVTSAALFASLFWRSLPHALLASLAAAIVLIVAGFLVATRRWARHLRPADGTLAAPAQPRPHLDYLRRVSLLAAALGSIWAAALACAYRTADPSHRTIVVAVAVALMSNSFLVGAAAQVAILYLAPLILGSLVSLLVSGDATCLALCLLLAIYAAYVATSVRLTHRRSVRSSRGRLRVQQQNETIGLLLRDFEENASDWLWETDAAFRLRHVSPRFAAAARVPARDLEGADLASLVSGDRALWSSLREAVVARVPFRDLLVRHAAEDPQPWWQLTGKPVLAADGALVGWRGVGSDVTAARASEAEIARLAASDVLTGLANRATFDAALGIACTAAISRGGDLVLLHADLDGFRQVNDHFGRHTADQLLIQVARRLAAGTDAQMTVARLGGDEFAILMPGRAAADAAALAAAVVETIGRPYAIEDFAVEIGVSIGVACLPGDADGPDGLLRQADLALAQAKSRGQSGFAFYDRALGNQALIRTRLRQDLRFALERRELAVHYQPIVDLDSGRISGFEALLRWNHPALGPISPAIFIPIAEATGLIVPIGAWVLREACAEAARWPAGMRVAINLSPVQFRGSDLLPRVRAALYESRLPPASLELEITETALLEATRPTLEVLHQLRALGVRVALDDFGTGYASLGYLVTFPFDKIKVDQSFIRDIGRREECAAVVDAMIHLARRIGMEVTAEGVECTDQALALRRKGCDQMQGFLISPARPPETARGMIGLWTPFGGTSLAAKLRPATDEDASGRRVDRVEREAPVSEQVS